MLPTLYIIRHGLTKANKDAIIAGGGYETDLLEEGAKQAKEAGAWLKNKGIVKVFASPLKRVGQTLEAMNLEGVEVECDARLKEMFFAEYEGTDFRKIPMELKLERMFENLDLRRGSGESVRELFARVEGFVEEKLRGVEGPVLIVGHGVTNRALLNVLLPHKCEELKTIHVENCSIYKVEKGAYEKVFAPKVG